MTKSIRRQDYQPSIFLIPKVSIELLITEKVVEVTSTLEVVLNQGYNSLKIPSLRLNGENITLISVELDGLPLPTVIVESDTLIIQNIPKKIAKKFTLRIRNFVNLASNKQCTGLFISEGILASHCEPEGFRRITYFLDRPDVLSVYTVSIQGRKSDYPVMLSNGDLLNKEDIGEEFHRITWHDPQPKSCYLFAVVAGNLFCRDREFFSANGRKVMIQFWASQVDIENVDYSSDCLINAMQWEERKYGIDIDLNLYKVVAIKNFPVGGMENKGLNIFNSRLICTNKDTTTDMGFLAAEGIVAHEFFHNWTGNRVAIRDWFQLSLKEGLTVYRDQEFCTDQSKHSSGKSCRRIQVVSAIRAIQFSEDSGSLAHSILPISYKKIENFYSATVYIKSAEIVRMLSIILGDAKFSRCLVYFLKKFDGKSATWDNFFDAFEEISEENLFDLKKWLYVKGTPKIVISDKYIPDQKRYELVLEQSIIGEAVLHIPLLSKLIFDDEEINSDGHEEFLINLKSKRKKIVFEGVIKKPLLSINRNFTSPVIIEQATDEKELLKKFSLDDNEFMKWDSVHQLFSRLILSGDPLNSEVLDGLKAIFVDKNFSSEFKVQFFTLPQNEYLYSMSLEVDPFSIEHQKLDLYKRISINLEKEILSQYLQLINENTEFEIDFKSIGDRAFKNKCLEMLILVNSKKYLSLAISQYHEAKNLTDIYGALKPIVKFSCKGYEDLLQKFYDDNVNSEKIIDMWTSMHAIQLPGPDSDVIRKLNRLISSREFGIANPLRLSNLLLSYFYENPLSFHNPSGDGYVFWSECTLLLDKINPSLSTQIAKVLKNWRYLKNPNRLQIEGLLKAMIAENSTSENLQEILINMLDLQHQ